MKYTRQDLRDGTVARLNAQLETARHFLAALQMQLDAGRDVGQTAEALSTTTDRILESAAALRTLDSLADSNEGG